MQAKNIIMKKML